MFWRKKEPKYTLAEFNALYATVAEKVTAMNVEARKANMVEQGLLPQEHLSREDMLKNRQRLQMEGQQALGRRIAGTPDDPDLCARDE
jgi:hypothetical protein